eukprot:403360374
MFKNKFKRLVRSVDMYGAPINLMYKSKDTYQTILGGIFTIITRLAVLAFFMYGLINVYNKNGSIVKKTLYRDPLKENIRVEADQQKFDLGITFGIFDSSSDFYENVYRYFQVKVSNATVSHDNMGGYQWDEDFFKLSPCTQERFGGDQIIAKQMHTDTMLCPDNLKFIIAGSLTGNFSAFSIFIKPCDNEVLAQQNKNFTYLEDSWFGNMIGKVQYSYLELIKGTMQYFKAQEGGNAQFSIQFYTSSNEDHTTRSVKTFMDCISLTGGLSSVFALIAKLTIVKIQQKYLHQSIIKKLFKIQKSFKKRRNNFSISEKNDQIPLNSLPQKNQVEDSNKLRLDNNNYNILEKKKQVKNQLTYFQDILLQRVKPQINYVGIIGRQMIQKWICCYFIRNQKQTNAQILVKNAMHMLYQQFDVVKVLKSSQKSCLLMKLNLDQNHQLLSEYTYDNLIPSKLINKQGSNKYQRINQQLNQSNNDEQFSNAISNLLEKSKTDKLSQKLLDELFREKQLKRYQDSSNTSMSKSNSLSKSSQSKSSKGQDKISKDKTLKEKFTFAQKIKSLQEIAQDNVVKYQNDKSPEQKIVKTIKIQKQKTNAKRDFDLKDIQNIKISKR